MKITLTVTGDVDVKRKLTETRDGLMMGASVGVAEVGSIVYDDLAEYSAPIPTSDYVRTYNYRDGLAPMLTVEPDSVDYTVTETVDYSKWLRGDGDYPGAWMHVGRWQSLMQIIAKRTPLAMQKVADAVVAFLARVWGN